MSNQKEVIRVYVKPEMASEFKTYCDTQGLSQSAMLRLLINKALSTYPELSDF
jgi:hypothetical protein